MTKKRKTSLPLIVQQAGRELSRWKTRALSLIRVLLVVPVSGSAAWAVQGQPDWVEEISPAGAVVTSASHVPRAEAYEYLQDLGLTAGTVADPEVGVYGSDASHGVREAKADWAMKRLELNGKFALRQSTEVLGQAMTVTSVISPDGLLVTDDRGGWRIEAYREFPVATCYRGVDGACDGASFDAAKDDHGTIVEFVRDHDGFPLGVRFGETLVLRYKFTPPLPEPPSMVRQGDRWREPSSWDLIDLRASEIVMESTDAAQVASLRPALSVFFAGIGEVIRVEGGEPFAVVQGAWGGPYALLPLETTSDIWRSVYASGDMSWRYKFRVDYTDDLVRVEIKAGEFGQSIVVEAPRGVNGVAPISLIHPGVDTWTDAMRSGVRLRTMERLDTWLNGAFEKESLPIVLRPFHSRGIEMGAGVVRGAAASGVESHLQFGPADGCEEKGHAIVCAGGESEVFGEESAYPW